MGGASAQKEVGGNRVMDLLKELETARKERAAPSDTVGETVKTETKQKENATSVIGS